MHQSLIEKYNVAGPRYTSYPTVPFWDDTTYNEKAWLGELRRTFELSNGSSGISLYVHLPFCESLCTFCACHKRITKNHSVEESYIEAVLHEWQLYRQVLGSRPRLAEIHLGGGTPSFFSAQNLRKLIEGLLRDSDLTTEYEFSFEGHPNNTTEEHLQTLYDLGFRRVSFGVQDYDPVVQRAIHRIQPFEQVQHVTEVARRIGYTSISHDLVFGLPFQGLSSIQGTIEQTIRLRPDRLAFYSYAHVPWMKGNGQRGFNDEDLPTGTEKRALYEAGRALFEANGYLEIGMDHFALPHDSLSTALRGGTLHRNFMGYTTAPSKVLLGLGMSSISDAWTAFSQNVKGLDEYYQLLNANQLPLLRGHLLNDEDVFVRQQILNIMCKMQTTWRLSDWPAGTLDALGDRLEVFAEDQLIEYNQFGLRVLPQGLPFVRNICMAFDQRLLRSNPQQRLFSQTI
jgi:oxygen-independent coproporphyrinogen III oxidase